MKHLTTLIFVFSLALGVIPHSAGAYFTTAQNAFTADDTTGVFTIDFKFGHEKYDIYIPIHAIHGGNPSESQLSYVLRGSDNEIVKGSPVGIVLSNARVKDDMYVIPKGKSATLTLLVLFTHNTVTTPDTYTLAITHLPFSFNGTQQLKLNPSELKYYTTKPLSLSK